MRKPALRRVLHFLAASIGLALWCVMLPQWLLLVALVRLGDWIWPDADYGDCWIYAITQWLRHGGHLRVKVHRLGWLPIPRASWQDPNGMVHRAEPVHRARTLREAWYGLRVPYFRYRVVTYPPIPRSEAVVTWDTGQGDL